MHVLYKVLFVCVVYDFHYANGGECDCSKNTCKCCTHGLARDICVNFSNTNEEDHVMKALLKIDDRTISSRITKSYSFKMCVPKTKICLKYNKIEAGDNFWCMVVHDRYNEYQIYYPLPCLKENGTDFEQKPNFYIHNNFLWDIIYPELIGQNNTSNGIVLLSDSVKFSNVTEKAVDVDKPRTFKIANKTSLKPFAGAGNISIITLKDSAYVSDNFYQYCLVLTVVISIQIL